MHCPRFVIRAQLTMDLEALAPILCVRVLMPAKGGRRKEASFLLENLIPRAPSTTSITTTVYLVFDYMTAFLWPPSATVPYHPHVYFRVIISLGTYASYATQYRSAHNLHYPFTYQRYVHTRGEKDSIFEKGHSFPESAAQVPSKKKFPPQYTVKRSRDAYPW